MFDSARKSHARPEQLPGLTPEETIEYKEIMHRNPRGFDEQLVSDNHPRYLEQGIFCNVDLHAEYTRYLELKQKIDAAQPQTVVPGGIRGMVTRFRNSFGG